MKCCARKIILEKKTVQEKNRDRLISVGTCSHCQAVMLYFHDNKQWCHGIAAENYLKKRQLRDVEPSQRIINRLKISNMHYADSAGNHPDRQNIRNFETGKVFFVGINCHEVSWAT